MLVFFEVWARASYQTSFVFNLTNVQSILLAAVQPLLIALGQTLVIIAGGIDLSVGFTVGLAAVVSARVMQTLDPSLPPALSLLLAIVVALLASLGVGWVNGILIARWKVPPFIGTLGMYGVARGLGFLTSGGTTVGTDNPVNSALGNGKMFGLVPWPVVVTFLVVLYVHYLLSRTKFGQYTYAIGGNRNAAIRAGINVDAHTMKLYLITAVLAGVAGAIYTARFTAGAAQAGEPTLLDSIAAVVIGGASLFGGAGTVVGTVIGALIIAVIQFGLVFINVQPFWQFIAVGAVIILSVLVDQARTRRGRT
ncbi:ribose ABC transporter [Deinococcus koreensis]|uniref:Ribose ABC transporter n=1 Tax=Deinococcus koreensis TaxID=2054903 RepID=A0A2K3UTR9_9DEIO|nr:ribose ABC transporter [Deinococcus koreensis]